MDLRKFALTVAIMAVAWPIMIISAPVLGAMAGTTSVVFYYLFGSGYWQSIPVINLAPLMLVYLVYCVGIYGAIFWVMPKKQEEVG